MTIHWYADEPDYVWVNDQRVRVEILDVVMKGAK